MQVWVGGSQLIETKYGSVESDKPCGKFALWMPLYLPCICIMQDNDSIDFASLYEFGKLFVQLKRFAFFVVVNARNAYNVKTFCTGFECL